MYCYIPRGKMFLPGFCLIEQFCNITGLSRVHTLAKVCAVLSAILSLQFNVHFFQVDLG